MNPNKLKSIKVCQLCGSALFKGYWSQGYTIHFCAECHHMHTKTLITPIGSAYTYAEERIPQEPIIETQ